MTRSVIVTIDDEPHIRQVITRKLTRAGYDVHAACDGLKGLELVTTLNPRLLITDFKMPGLNGIEVCAACRQDTQLESLPIIVLTGSTAATGDLQARVKAFGNVTCMSKPFSLRELVKVVEGLIKPDRAG